MKETKKLKTVALVAIAIAFAVLRISALQPAYGTPPAQSSDVAVSPRSTQEQPQSSPEPTQGNAQPEAPAVPQFSSQPASNAAPAKKKMQSNAASKKRTSAKKPARQKPSGKVVVRNGGVADNPDQLAPGMTQEQEFHARENTAQLLATTDSNLKALAGRQLSAAQQSMLDQVHSYVRQSKAASDSGDLNRAHTLAYKAHLLSDELAQ